jgi:hypothetical protein
LLAGVIAIMVNNHTVDPEQISKLSKQGIAYEIQPGESFIQKTEREEREKEEKIKLSLVKTTSYTGYGNPIIIGTSWEQCVVFAKRKAGITKSIGYAGTAKIDGYEPREGAIGIEKNLVGHAVYIEKIIGDEAIITEANYIRGKITQRTLPLNKIKGYIY